MTLHLQKLGNGGGKSDERSTGVQNDTSVVHLSSLIAKGDGIEVNLPVGLAPQWDLSELARVVTLINAAESGDRLLLLVGVSEIKGEDGLVQKSLVEHVIERRDNLVHADCIVAQTHDAVEPAEGKSKTRLRGCLGKVLVLDLQIANLESVLRHVARERTGAITDLKLGSVRLIC